MKADLTKLHKAYYTAKTTVEVTESGTVHYLSVTGKGDPSGEDFAKDIQSLYTLAYAVKFLMKGQGLDFVVAKLEGLWSFDTQRFGEPDMTDAAIEIPRSEWEYRLLIRMPDFVNTDHFKLACEQSLRKGKITDSNKVEWFTMDEGPCVHILHIGPFHTEPESLQKIKVFCEKHELLQNGTHHEIYLSDFRKTPPEKLRTILREPVRKNE